MMGERLLWLGQESLLVPGQRERSKDGFSFGEMLSREVEPRWLELKERGNEALRKGDFGRAVEEYTRAYEVATAYSGQMKAVAGLLETLPKTSATRRVFSTDDLVVKKIMPWLRWAPRRDVKANVGPVKFTYSLPNLPAAICLGNRSTAYAKSGNHFEAKRDASEARKYCPEYLRAHEKYRAALRALGEIKEAKTVAEEIADYKKVCPMQSWNGPALLMAGWIDHFSFQRYEVARQSCLLPLIQRHSRDDSGASTVNGAVSLVPFRGGQWMFFNLRYFDRDVAALRKVDLFAFAPVDNANDDMLEILPHGKASKRALENEPEIVDATIAMLADADVTVTTLTCGQGLVDHVDFLSSALDDTTSSKVLVTPAISTRVSEDAGLDPLGLTSLLVRATSSPTRF
mmetsp:Transcript_1754/g.5908  ORF Transcript_1754/g.5908 Transcript_1754/m.5908 type:complete len:401 (-) Transcript_1754:135-1337(-)